MTPNGRVFLTSIDWIASQKAERAWLAPRLHASDRIAAACDERLLTPAWLQCRARQGEGRGGAVARAPHVLVANLPACSLLPLARPALKPLP